MSRHHRYSGVAKGAEWERLRRQTLERDKYRCTDCKKAGRLEVHHILELKNGGTNDPSNLKTLCRECHMGTHRRPMTKGELEWKTMVDNMTERHIG